MGDGSLSQDEIDALLQGADDMLSSPAAGPAVDMAMGAGSLSPVERDSLADALNRAMAVAAPSLSVIFSEPHTTTRLRWSTLKYSSGPSGPVSCFPPGRS